MSDHTQKPQYKDTGISPYWFIGIMFVITFLISILVPDRHRDLIYNVGVYGGFGVFVVGTIYRQYLRRKKLQTNDAVALQAFGILVIIITDARNLFI